MTAQQKAIAAAIAHVRDQYPVDLFPDNGTTTGNAARMARLTCDNIEREIRERMAELDATAAPVVVGEDRSDELKALRVQEWMQREFNELASVQDIQQAMRTPCSCHFTEAALAGEG